MSIEEMINSGSSFEDAYDKLVEMWDSAVAAKEQENKLKDARKALVQAFKDYYLILMPNTEIDDTQLELIVAQSEEEILKYSKKYKEPIKSTKKIDKKPLTYKNLEDFLQQMGW